MKKALVFVISMMFLISLGAMAMAQENKPEVMKEKLVTARATVEGIDLQNRMISLKGPKGNVVDLKVDERVKNLPQVKVGDEVVANYYESVAVRVLKPGETGGASKTQIESGAKPGENPAGVVANQVTATATVEAIDPEKTYVTLRGPRGNMVDVRVRDPENLENVRPGDQLLITYSQALAVSVEKADK